MAEYNKIISTVNSITQDLTIIPDSTDVMVIDTSNNRIGINTIDPGYSIHVNDGTIKTTDLIVDDINTISFSQLIEDLRQLYRDISNTDGITLNRDSYTILKD